MAVEPSAEVTIDDAVGWGDDEELEVDPEAKTVSLVADGEGGWDVEDADLEIPDLGPAQAVEGGNSYVHLPTQGI